MKNTNYKYNPNTLNYEKINLTLWDKFKRLSYYLIASVVVSVLILSFSFYNIKSFIQKEDVLTKTLKSQLNSETFKFLMVLVKRDRINLLSSVIIGYLELVYKTASVKMIEVSTAFPFTTLQKLNLIKKLKELTNAREIRLVVTVDSSLIGGFLIKTNSKVIDFTIKNQLENLAKHLDGVLEI